MREEEQFWRSIGKEIVRQRSNGEHRGREGGRKRENGEETLKRSQREEMTERDAL